MANVTTASRASLCCRSCRGNERSGFRVGAEVPSRGRHQRLLAGGGAGEAGRRALRSQPVPVLPSEPCISGALVVLSAAAVGSQKRTSVSPGRGRAVAGSRGEVIARRGAPAALSAAGVRASGPSEWRADVGTLGAACVGIPAVAASVPGGTCRRESPPRASHRAHLCAGGVVRRTSSDRLRADRPRRGRSGKEN